MPKHNVNISPRLVLRWTAVIGVLCLIVGCLLPEHAKISLGTHPGEITSLQHRAFHFAAFGAAALFLLLRATNKRQKWRAGLALFGLGVLLEVIQSRFYGNGLEWWDIRDNGYGILIAFAAVGLWARLSKRRSSSSKSTRVGAVANSREDRTEKLVAPR